MIDVLGPEKRRRRTTQEKDRYCSAELEPGNDGPLAAWQHGVAASQLFLWRKQYREGSLTAVQFRRRTGRSASELAAMKQIKEPSACSAKTMENELPKKPLNMGVQKSG